MRRLLDTHAFLWFILDEPQLSSKADALISDPVLLNRQSSKLRSLHERLLPPQEGDLGARHRELLVESGIVGS